jgi:hypothetical protein
MNEYPTSDAELSARLSAQRQELETFKEDIQDEIYKSAAEASDKQLNLITSKLNVLALKHEQALKITLEKQAEEHKQALTVQSNLFMFVFLVTFLGMLALVASLFLWGLTPFVKNEVIEQLSRQQAPLKPGDVSTQPAPVTLLPPPPSKVLHQAKP